MSQTNSPYITLTLTNLFKMLAFMSPFLITFFIIMYIIISPTSLVQGLLFLLGLTFVTILNTILKYILKLRQPNDANPVCNLLPLPFTVSIGGEIYSSPSTSVTLLSFISTYMIYPMYVLYSDSNPGLLVTLLSITLITGAVEWHQNCASLTGIILALLVGIIFAFIYISIVSMSNSKELVYIFKTNSDAEKCYKPSKTKFKCTRQTSK